MQKVPRRSSVTQAAKPARLPALGSRAAGRMPCRSAATAAPALHKKGHRQGVMHAGVSSLYRMQHMPAEATYLVQAWQWQQQQ
jgi:hypothetical protein